MMMVSMMGAGIASMHYSPRTIGVVAGILSSTTAIFWFWANSTDHLPRPVFADGPHLPEIKPDHAV
jgi:hypothetical protein